MNPLIQLCKNTAKLNPNMIFRTLLSEGELQVFILDLNRFNQLFDKGIDSRGVSLGEYSPATIEGIPGLFKGKIEKGLPFDHITLFDFGFFYESFEIIMFDKSFVIDADGQKDDNNLFVQYGDDVLGLTDDSLQLLIDKIKPLFIQEIRNEMFKGVN